MLIFLGSFIPVKSGGYAYCRGGGKWEMGEIGEFRQVGFYLPHFPYFPYSSYIPYIPIETPPLPMCISGPSIGPFSPRRSPASPSV